MTSHPCIWHLTGWVVLLASTFALSASAQEVEPMRTLRVAIYPIVPQKAEMIAQIKKAFEVNHHDVRLEFIDLTADYYKSPLMMSLDPTAPNKYSADVVEADTVFLQDLVAKGWVAPVPGEALKDEGDFLPNAVAAVKVKGEIYGVPHWVCGNFLFFRQDDPAAQALGAVNSVKDLETVLHSPASEQDGVVVDVDGSTTVGEFYAGALFDEYRDIGQVISHLNDPVLDPQATQAILHLYRLCPGGLNHNDEHHGTEDFYAREFGRRKARGLIGYSEQLFYVEDEMLHGTAKAVPAPGNAPDFGLTAVAAPLSDDPTRMLGYVDALTMRAGLDEQTRRDAIAFIAEYTSFDLNRALLVPAEGQAPRYLLPARLKLYEDAQLRKSAPLYERFAEYMKRAETIDAPGLVGTMRARGGDLNQRIISSATGP